MPIKHALAEIHYRILANVLTVMKFRTTAREAKSSQIKYFPLKSLEAEQMWNFLFVVVVVSFSECDGHW